MPDHSTLQQRLQPVPLAAVAGPASVQVDRHGLCHPATGEPPHPDQRACCRQPSPGPGATLLVVTTAVPGIRMWQRYEGPTAPEHTRLIFILRPRVRQNQQVLGIVFSDVRFTRQLPAPQPSRPPACCPLPCMLRRRSSPYFTPSSLQVRKHGNARKFAARVVAVGHECDVAMLTVDEEEFWADVDALRVADHMPAMQETVTVVGFPTGGAAAAGIKLTWQFYLPMDACLQCMASAKATSRSATKHRPEVH